jgi:tyrosyl-tRNA synthetase
LTDLTSAEIDGLKKRVVAGAVHPKQAKVDLARRIVTDFHSKEAGERAAEAFEARFTRREVVADTLPVILVSVPGADIDAISLIRLIVQAGLASSSSDASRKIQQGAVKVDREKVTDIKARIEASRGAIILEVGRRAVRVELTR